MKLCGKSLGAGALVATLCAPAELGVTVSGERDGVAEGDKPVLRMAEKAHRQPAVTRSTRGRAASAGSWDYLATNGERGSGCAFVTVMLAAEPPPTYCP